MQKSDLQGVGDHSRRYSAFISYSHADSAFAKRLHRALESYRLPHRALARADGSALSGARLKPVFRDIDELTAAHDLTAAVREAIAQSDHLIVVCSPSAAASPWVAKEIELFRELHGDAGILAALAQGEPAAAFPETLRGAAADLEPLAADFRGDGSSRHLALLKLVAALAGVRLDELMQRDAQRRMRNLGLAAAAAVASVAVVAGLSVAALNARADADLQRQRAGGLGEFMATDLRNKLEAAGRHDILDQVNRAALESYKKVDPDNLTPDQLLQRAKLLQGAGKDAEKAGDLKAAHAQFEAAHRMTAGLLRAKPDDPQRIFAHAQSEYWIGFINWREGDGVRARTALQGYARLADRLVAIDPHNDDWRMEQVYAASNLGTLALRQAGRPTEAERYFNEKLTALSIVQKHRPGDQDTLKSTANGYAWLADCQRLQGKYQAALQSREAERSILARLLSATPKNARLREAMLGHDLAVARIDGEMGRSDRAFRELESGRRASLEMAEADPSDADYAKQARMFELFKVRTWLGMPAKRRPNPQVIGSVLGDCHQGFSDTEINDFCATLLARLKSDAGDIAGAQLVLQPVVARAARSPNILTAHWGINMAEEARPVLVGNERGKEK